MPFQPRTFTDQLTRMAYRVVARTDLTDLEEGGVLHTVLAGVARELDDLSYQQVQLMRIWDLDTATGDDLDERAKDVNPDEITRKSAAKAAGTAVFSRTGNTGAVVIPSGSKINVPDGGAEYATAAASSISDGDTDSPSVPIQAIEAGDAGNADADTITEMGAIAGIETVTNDAACTGGQDAETDPQLRERIKTYLRSLSRGTPDALKYAALSVTVTDYGSVKAAEVVELAGADLGKVEVYIDDGAGTVNRISDNYGSAETVVSSATGGEIRVSLANAPVKVGATLTVTWLDSVASSSHVLTEGTDYTLNYATGQITLIPGGPAGIPSGGLQPTDGVTAEYTYYLGLIPEVQKTIDGDASDRNTYPGYRAAGTHVTVLPPTVYQQIVTGTIVLEDGYSATTVVADAKAAINRYINGLGINADVVVSELVYQVQAIPGVYDVSYTAPLANVVIGTGELARVESGNIDLSGA